jgi:alkylhydroperoxidase family enzyme
VGWFAARQPALMDWGAQLVANPPVPLASEESRAVGLDRVAILYALDQVVTGRPAP